MPRVYHVKKARKDNPVVKAGEPYYWWKFAFGPKQYSKTYPKRSLLTQSNFLSQFYDLQDSFSLKADSLEDDVSDLISNLEMLRDECQDSLDNMPEHLQESSDSGMLLTERIENLDMAISEIESIDLSMEDLETDEDSRLEEIMEEIGTAIGFE
jgi:chromosome condensin MukBEF complex kleisin-like MukF subunit